MTRPIVLINSGAYVPQELSAEFGPLPPTFLPVGMRRLYELQIDSLHPFDADVYLTVPESFPVPLWDAARLQELKVRLIRSPDGLELGAALLYALASTGLSDRPLRILHGDTLILDLDLAAEDAVSAAEGADGYRWAAVEQADGRVQAVSRPEIVTAGPCSRLSGYFAFASSAHFAEALALSQGDFFKALSLYAKTRGLRFVEAGRWYDFGHVQTFFRSRRLVTTARSFNSLQIGEASVRKRSEHEEKIRAEAHWFRSIPPSLRPYSARLLNEGEDEQGFFYETEYEYMPTLAELNVFGRLQPGSWQRILTACKAFLDAAVMEGSGSGADTSRALHQLVVGKAADRLEQYARATNLDLDAPNRLNGRTAPSLRYCLTAIGAVIGRTNGRPSVMHGDFCFSNILYDFRTDRIRLLDPRGKLESGPPTIYGDVHYDVAKLMHSIVGRYDVIIAGHQESARIGPNEFNLHFPADEGRSALEGAAAAMEMGGVPLRSPAVSAAMISLFLSMAPLHSDRPDRQTAFIANALRLFLEFEEHGA